MRFQSTIPLSTRIRTFFPALAVIWAASPALSADIEVRIEGLRSAEGVLRAALHRQAESVRFPEDSGVVAAIFRPAAAGEIRLVFADMPPGQYAIAAFHDADSNGELNSNSRGIPIEGYGFSNGALGFMGPPEFADVAVTVAPGESDILVLVPIQY